VVQHQKFRVALRFAEEMFRTQDRADERERKCNAMRTAMEELETEVKNTTKWPQFLGVSIRLTAGGAFFGMISVLVILVGGPKAFHDGLKWLLFGT